MVGRYGVLRGGESLPCSSRSLNHSSPYNGNNITVSQDCSQISLPSGLMKTEIEFSDDLDAYQEFMQLQSELKFLIARKDELRTELESMGQTPNEELIQLHAEIYKVEGELNPKSKLKSLIARRDELRTELESMGQTPNEELIQLHAEIYEVERKLNLNKVQAPPKTRVRICSSVPSRSSAHYPRKAKKISISEQNDTENNIHFPISPFGSSYESLDVRLKLRDIKLEVEENLPLNPFDMEDEREGSNFFFFESSSRVSKPKPPHIEKVDMRDLLSFKRWGTHTDALIEKVNILWNTYEKGGALSNEAGPQEKFINCVKKLLEKEPERLSKAMKNEKPALSKRRKNVNREAVKNLDFRNKLRNSINEVKKSKNSIKKVGRQNRTYA